MWSIVIMDKPQNLYHASTSTDIEEFEPRNNSPRYSGEVNLVFATPSEALAAMFLAPADIPIEISIYGDEYVLFIESDRKTFQKKDRGGAIYTLPTDSFETDNVHGMKEIEWYSKVPVRPIAKKIYNTSVEAMDKYNIKRYFVSHQTMDKIRKNPADALNLVK